MLNINNLMIKTNIENFINLKKIKSNSASYKNSNPFNHMVIENFFDLKFAKKLEIEFLNYNSDKWYRYKNDIENKKALNDWNVFPEKTYLLFEYLISNKFVKFLSKIVGTNLFPDPGLHGGGWHIHGRGGNLNPHLDYSIHPKLGLQRKINLIIYISKNFKSNYGGHLGLWSNDRLSNQPANLIKEIVPSFNKAIIFDTTQNSWHGMTTKLKQPNGIYRKSLAIYYLCKPQRNVISRQRALFAPREDQKNNKNVQKLIKLRSNLKKSHLAYFKK